MTQQITPQQHIRPITEHILVVKSEFLFTQGSWKGLKEVNFDEYISIIQKNRNIRKAT